MESERKTCATHMEDMCSAVRSDWEKTRTQLAKEIATTLQVYSTLHVYMYIQGITVCVWGGGGGGGGGVVENVRVYALLVQV